MDTATQLWDVASRPWKLKGIPDSLVKAFFDPFDYALGLKNGTVIYFHEATPLLTIDMDDSTNHPELFTGWVRLSSFDNRPLSTSISVPEPELINGSPASFTFERGIDVLVSEIAWVADAPWGS